LYVYYHMGRSEELLYIE